MFPSGILTWVLLNFQPKRIDHYWLNNRKKSERYIYQSYLSIIPSKSQIVQIQILSGLIWVEPVLSKDKCVLPMDTTQLVTPVRLEPAAPWTRVKHSITEPLCSLKISGLSKTNRKYLNSLPPSLLC